MRTPSLPRRRLLQGLGAAAGAGLLARSARGDDRQPAFLIVLGAAGGASIIDSFLAIRASESSRADTLNTFPDASVKTIAGSPFRAVDLTRDAIGPIPFGFTTRQSAFVQAHRDDMLVATLTGTSVNHAVAQERSRNGNAAWLGRTLDEIVALTYGEDLALPNVNMATGGYAARGTDASLPSWAYGVPVAAPQLWPFGLDGSKGIAGAPGRDLVTSARALRDGTLEPGSSFDRAFRDADALRLWREQRTAGATRLEGGALIDKLNLFRDSDATPLGKYGLSESPDAALLASTFPALAIDELEAQAALAYLLIKNRVSTSVTIAPTFSVLLEANHIINPPLAFDFSHSANRGTQAVMWDRMLGIADKLIELLRSTPLDEATGVSFWDRTLLYVATDFGRTKTRAPGSDEFGCGHDLNNGVLLLSPMLKGNRVLGGVDPETALTFGFDPTSGEPDPGRTMTEAEIFSGILDVLDIDRSGSGLPAVTAFRG